MEATRTSGVRFYRPELDVIRFIAFLLVFLHHVLPIGGDIHIDHLLGSLAPVFYAFINACGYGLSLFFTLSAFLICELLLRERESAGKIGIKQFYIRRILRIWPLYYFALALGVIVALLPSGNHADLTRIGWFAIFMGAWLSAIHGWTSNPVNPLWSISVEEQFYLLAPGTVKYFSRKALYGFCAAVILIANGWLYFLGSVQATGMRVWADSFVQFECFAAGILLCLALRGRAIRISLLTRIIIIIACSFCWMTASYGLHACFVQASANPGSWPLIGGYSLASLGCVLMLIAFLGVDSKLLPGWAIYLGRISYGLYVYHQFAIYMTTHLLTSFLISNHCPKSLIILGLTILMAALSYRFIETPFLKMKKRHAVIESQPIAGVV